jgi:hypothetical protein
MNRLPEPPDAPGVPSAALLQAPSRPRAEATPDEPAAPAAEAAVSVAEAAVPVAGAVADASAPAARSAPPPSRRERSIAVETEALGLLRVRRVSLGGIARTAERLRSAGTGDDHALVDALIAEVATSGDGAGGPRRRIAADQVAKLTDTDRRSIAAAVLTLEGVKAAGEGVVEDPLASLVLRYGPVVGVGEHARRTKPVLEDTPSDPPASEVVPAPQHPEGLDDQAELPDQAALPEAGGHGEEHRLPGEQHAVVTAQGSEPQIPLFDPGQVPPGVAHRLPEREAPSAAEARASRAAERARIEEMIDAQHRTVLGVADEQHALAAEVAALAQRAERAEADSRRNRWLAAGAIGAAVALSAAQALWFASASSRLADEQQQLRARLDQQAAEIRDLRAAAARADRPATSRAPAPAATAPAKARKDSGARAR